jgi:signal transduction histidine kinase
MAAVRVIAWHIDTDEMLEIDADRGQIYRILTNLVRNALQALETATEIEAPRIEVSARRDGNDVTLSVADNGPGVAPRARENLFKAFQGSARVGGTGLGLAISAELARAHGGDVWLDDRGPGATFHVKLANALGAKGEPGSPREPHARGILAFGRAKH